MGFEIKAGTTFANPATMPTTGTSKVLGEIDYQDSIGDQPTATFNWGAARLTTGESTPVTDLQGVRTHQSVDVGSITFDHSVNIDHVGEAVSVQVTQATPAPNLTNPVELTFTYLGYSARPDGSYVLIFSGPGQAASLQEGNGVRYYGISTDSLGELGKTSSVDGEIYGNGSEDSGLPVFPNVPDGTIIVCFLAGALIETEAGHQAVETLKAGQMVAVYHDGQRSFQPLQRLSTQRRVVRTQDDLAVVFKKDSLADGVPSQDLAVTPDHCMFFEGRFVPARMLVNDRSIVLDEARKEFDVYHVELEEHAVISASGALTESLLETSRSAVLANGITLGAVGAKSWEKDAAAPLCVDASFVRPIYERLLARAIAAELPAQRQPALLTPETDLHLVTSAGLRLQPKRSSGNWQIFALPAGTNSVQIVSRTGRPDQVIGRFMDDRRELGVLVGAVQLIVDGQTHQVTTHHQTNDLAGWDAQESAPYRWTNGDALLPLPAQPLGAECLLAVEVLAGGPYLLEDEASFVEFEERLAG